MSSPMLEVKQDGSALGEQTLCNACCCYTLSCDPNDCNPSVGVGTCCTKLLGQTTKSYMCCFEDSSAFCLCPTHELFEQTVTGPTPQEDVCCICCHREVNLVKPMCLSGAKPLCKGYSDGCCMQSRSAFPCDNDVLGMYGCYGIKCCDCAPKLCCPCTCNCKACVKLPALSREAQAQAIDVEEGHMSDEYLVCGMCCCLYTMYIPGTYNDAFGCSDNSLWCCCYDNECKACLLPLHKEEAALLLGVSGQGRMIKPPIRKGGPCFKGVTRTFCSVTKFAFPCDQEVPCVVAVCGYKLVERTIDGRFQWGDDSKKPSQLGDPVPLFAKVRTAKPMSVKEKSLASGKLNDNITMVRT